MLKSEKVKRCLSEKGAGMPCESCGHNEWVLLTNFATLVLQDSTKSSGLSSYPVVAVVCKNCGNMRLYDREKLGICEDI